MGLLTAPSTSKRRSLLGKYLINFKYVVCGLLYLAGIVYFCVLAHSSRNNGTYFSENALLPGLVYSEIRPDTVNHALQLADELARERETHKSTMPTAWLLAKMRQVGLETYAHNFTLNYPLGGGRVFHGKNVYGIMRAPRIGSTESLVISAPYRAADSIHPEVMHSIPILLAFANFVRKQKHWAKDIIFLVTDQEQLGMQAWLEAYYGSDTYNQGDVLNCGTLDGRAGSIQAAINLELQSFDVDYIDVKIEGLNGQLPNLDLMNLVQRLALKEGIVSGHKQRSTRRRSGTKSLMKENLLHMISMVLTQSTGVPNGNHGLFFRYGIQAVTLEAHKRESTNHQRTAEAANSLLKLLEGISRSLNNLLERFHQSFFFYLLVASDRFISIGDYMPSIALMVGALLVKAFILWLSVNQKAALILVEEQASNEDNEDIDEDTDTADDIDDTDRVVNVDDRQSEKDDASDSVVTMTKPKREFNFIAVGKFLIIAHTFGVIAAYLPFIESMDRFFFEMGIKTEVYLFFTLWILGIVSLVTPLFVSLNALGVEILHIAALLETGTSLIIISMVNFSLALLLSVFIVPFGILISPTSKRFYLRTMQFWSLLINPLMVAYLAVLCLTWWSFSELSILAILSRSLTATMDAVTFAIVDSIIYGNWLYPVIAMIFFPIWIMFFNVLCIPSQPDQEETTDIDEMSEAMQRKLLDSVKLAENDEKEKLN